MRSQSVHGPRPDISSLVLLTPSSPPRTEPGPRSVAVALEEAARAVGHAGHTADAAVLADDANRRDRLARAAVGLRAGGCDAGRDANRGPDAGALVLAAADLRGLHGVGRALDGGLGLTFRFDALAIADVVARSLVGPSARSRRARAALDL